MRLHARELRTVGVPESDLDERIAPIYKRYGDVQTTILAGLGEIQIHLRTWSKDSEAAERMLDELVKLIVLALGESIFTVSGQSLEEIVAARADQEPRHHRRRRKLHRRPARRAAHANSRQLLVLPGRRGLLQQ